jgi:hypothetical protein
MPVYSHRILGDLEAAIERIAAGFFARMPLILNPDEFVAAFINPDHVAELRRFEELVGKVGMEGFASEIQDGPDILPCQFAFSGGPPIILPRYVSHGLAPSCPPELRDKITVWMKERLRFGQVFGDVRDALTYLNEQCDNAGSLRVMLPCLPFLMDSINTDPESATAKRARTLAASKSFKGLPALPRKVKERLAVIASITNSVALALEAPLPELKRHHCLVQRRQYADKRTKSPNFILAALRPEQPCPSASFY